MTRRRTANPLRAGQTKTPLVCLSLTASAFVLTTVLVPSPLLACLLLSLFLTSLLLAGRLGATLRAVRVPGEEAETSQALAAAALHLKAVEALAQAIDAKDQTTQGHVRRTQVYAVETGKLLGLGPEEIEALRAGALLHDVGKLAVPDHILNKPGRLTPAEFEKMKVHTAVGGDIIRRVGFPYPVEEVVRHHHERWDGTGYPDGLKGEQIPLVARVISVVDFYDASRCDRPYRAGMTRAESLALLRGMAGKAFDPRVVEMFASRLHEFDRLIDEADIGEQVPQAAAPAETGPQGAEPPGPSRAAPAAQPPGLRTIAEAQREVLALHEIAQTIGASLNLPDTLTLVTGKLGELVPSDSCVVYVLEEGGSRARAVHAVGASSDLFAGRSLAVGAGVTGWVIANNRALHAPPPAAELSGLPAEAAGRVRAVLSAPLTREDGAFGAITLYSESCDYTDEHARLIEAVGLHASGAVGNALTHERIKETALTDPLTGLPNERALHLALERLIAECRRLGREPLALVRLDLNGFRAFNEEYGHGLGDRVLAAVAGLIKSQLRQMDVLARLDGDEFVAAMPSCAADLAAVAAERVCSAVRAARFPTRTGHAAKLTASYGVASFPADGQTPDEMLRAAERDMRLHRQPPLTAEPSSGDRRVVRLDAFR